MVYNSTGPLVHAEALSSNVRGFLKQVLALTGVYIVLDRETKTVDP